MDITKCDLCKKIKKEKESLISEESTWISGQIQGKGEFFTFDLCGKCSENLMKYIKRYLKFKKHTKKKLKRS